ncbi:MAG: hypothetical protein ACYDH5_20420 [Acidimicrobiales bacterium]
MVVVLLIVIAIAGAALMARSRAAVVQTHSERLHTVDVGTRRWRAFGLLAGLAGAAVAVSRGGLGRGILLAAPIFGLCVLAGVLVGELRVAAPGGPTRRAPLEVRRLADYLPRRLGSTVAATTVLLGAALGVATLTGSPDSLGLAGRALARHCSAVLTEAAGPWPGSYYAVPLAVAVVAGLLAAALASRRIVRRPRLGEDSIVDDALRHQAVTAVVAATGILVTIPLAGISLAASSAMLRIACRPQWWTVTGWALLALIPALVALMGWCAAALTPSGGPRSHTRPTTPVAR